MNNEEIVCLKEMVNLKLILLDALGIAQQLLSRLYSYIFPFLALTSEQYVQSCSSEMIHLNKICLTMST